MKRLLLIVPIVIACVGCATSGGLAPQETTRTYAETLETVKAAALDVLEHDEEFTITKVTETTIEATDKHGFQHYDLTMSLSETPDGCKVYAFVKLCCGGSVVDWGGSERRVVRILDAVDAKLK